VTRTLHALTLAGALIVASPALAADSTDRTITVEGQAEMRVVPDEVLLTLGVETDDMDIGAAREQNDRRVAAIVAAAATSGITGDYIRTDYLDIEPRYKDWPRSVFLGYFVRRSLVITLRDLTRFEVLLSSALTAGANYVHGVEFRTTELRKHRDDARVRAVRAAREKAEMMAGALGQQIGTPTRIQEGGNWWWSPYNRWWGRSGGGMTAQNVVQEVRGPAPEGGTVPGLISVSAAVSVTFALAQ